MPNMASGKRGPKLPKSEGPQARGRKLSLEAGCSGHIIGRSPPKEELRSAIQIAKCILATSSTKMLMACSSRTDCSSVRQRPLSNTHIGPRSESEVLLFH